MPVVKTNLLSQSVWVDVSHGAVRITTPKARLDKDTSSYRGQWCIGKLPAGANRPGTRADLAQIEGLESNLVGGRSGSQPEIVKVQIDE